jgi:hypothetical protein
MRPGGGHRIATLLRENNWDVEVIDWADEWSIEELQELVKSRVNSETKFFGFSAFFSHWSTKLSQFTYWLKETYPNIVTIYGAQGRPKFDCDSIDLYISGYGENALLAVLRKITGNSSPLDIIQYDDRFTNKKVILANDSYPSFPMKSLMIKHEKRDFIMPYEWLTVEYSRGCKFKCAYCNFPVLGVKGDYTRDADDYIEQLQYAYDNWGVDKYIAADETFNDRTEKIIKFADATEKLSFSPYVAAFIRADLLVSRKQDWDHLIRMGIVAHYYGIESMHGPSAKAIGKGMAPEKLQAGLIEVKDYFNAKTNEKYRGHISLIAGLPYETIDTLNKTAEWCRDNWAGQGNMIWPLEIPINDTLDVPSLLTKKWQEFGYEKVEDTEVINIQTIMETDNKQFIGHSINNLNWKNEHLTYEQVTSLCRNEMQKILIPNSGIGTFSLYTMSHILSLEEILQIRYSQSFNGRTARQWDLFATETLKDNIKKYVHKKLSI